MPVLPGHAGELQVDLTTGRATVEREALRELGRSVPGDVSVAGIDDIMFAPYTGPALSTIAVPQVDVGREAWQLLSPHLQNRKGRRTRTLRATFVPRDSTGKAP